MMKAAHDEIEIAADIGPWEFPIEVIVSEAKSAVVTTPEQEEKLADIVDDLSYPPYLHPEPHKESITEVG